MKSGKGRAHLLLSILIGASVFIYVLMKANYSSFTHDESFTYLHYPHDSFLEILSFSKWYTNNHILNSLLMKYSELLFGSSEFALRLPNLLALLIYLIYGYSIFRDKNPVLRIEIFLILSSNVLLLDLFGLARGYGLSIGFMLMSLYHFMAYIDSKKRKDLLLFHLAALLASLSNFTLLIFYASALTVYNLQYIINTRVVLGERLRLFQANKAHLIPLFVVGIVLWKPLQNVLTYSDLNFGGKTGFYADTVSFLIWNGLHGLVISDAVLLLLQVVVSLIVAVPFLIIIRKAIQGEASFFREQESLVSMNFLLIVISIAIEAQHLILKADYPVARFSIFLFPLFTMHLALFVQYLISLGYKRVPLIVFGTISLISALSFWSKANLSTSAEWAYDAKTKDMLESLTEYREHIGDNGTNVSLGINWLFEPTINFYRITRKLDWLNAVDREGIKESDDYLYLLKADFDALQTSNYETIEEFPLSGSVLVKRKD